MTGLPDLSDDKYWRALTPRQVLDLVAAQMDATYTGVDDVDGYDKPDPVEVIRDSLLTVGEDIQDRAVDQSWCTKLDACTGKAVFLAWLAWHLDDGFLNRFLHEAGQ